MSILKEIIKRVVKKYINEIFEDEYDFLSEETYNIFNSIKDKEHYSFSLINPIQYKRALQEFMQYGQFVRFPENKIYDWKDLVIKNIATLYALNSIHGHSERFPFDEFHDVFGDENIPEEHYHDFPYIYELLLEKYDIEEYLPKFSNGLFVISDYGIEPLFNLATKLIKQTKPEEIIITINQIMNVVHQRSDLSELFIQGGEKSHSMISNT